DVHFIDGQFFAPVGTGEQPGKIRRQDPFSLPPAPHFVRDRQAPGLGKPAQLGGGHRSVFIGTGTVIEFRHDGARLAGPDAGRRSGARRLPDGKGRAKQENSVVSYLMASSGYGRADAWIVGRAVARRGRVPQAGERSASRLVLDGREA